MKLDLPLAAGLAALSLAVFAPPDASAQPAPPKKPVQACFYARDIWSWAPVDRRTVNLRVNLHDYYQLKLVTDCGDIDWSQRIGLEARGGSWICSDMDLTVIAPSTLGPQRCLASGLRKLTPEDVAALPKNQKP